MQIKFYWTIYSVDKFVKTHPTTWLFSTFESLLELKTYRLKCWTGLNLLIWSNTYSHWFNCKCTLHLLQSAPLFGDQHEGKGIFEPNYPSLKYYQFREVFVLGKLFIQIYWISQLSWKANQFCDISIWMYLHTIIFIKNDTGCPKSQWSLKKQFYNYICTKKSTSLCNYNCFRAPQNRNYGNM